MYIRPMQGARPLPACQYPQKRNGEDNPNLQERSIFRIRTEFSRFLSKAPRAASQLKPLQLACGASALHLARKSGLFN